MKLSMEVGLGPGNIALDGDPASPEKGHSTPTFLTRVYCGQTARWIKMPLGTETDLGPGQIVLDGDPALPKGAQQPLFCRPPLFGPHLLWPNGRPSQLRLSTCKNAYKCSILTERKINSEVEKW